MQSIDGERVHSSLETVWLCCVQVPEKDLALKEHLLMTVDSTWRLWEVACHDMLTERS